MLEIDNLISKKELLDLLAEVANEPGDLLIQINSLPTFLTTPIAFTVFNYQVSNYPREIVWTSKNSNILRFLKSCNVRVDNNLSAEEKEVNNYFDLEYSEKNDDSNYVDGNNNYGGTNRLFSELSDELENEDLTPEIVEDGYPYQGMESKMEKLQEVGLKPVKVSSLPLGGLSASLPHDASVPLAAKSLDLQLKFPTFHNQKNQDLDKKNLLGSDLLTNRRPKLKAKDLLKDNSYKPSFLLDQEELSDNKESRTEALFQELEKEISKEAEIKQPFPFDRFETKNSEPLDLDLQESKMNQNLDSWLDKIEATREALGSYKKQQPSLLSNPEKSSLDWEDYLEKQKQNKKFRWLKFIFNALFLSCLLVVFLALFPSKVYTISVSPVTETKDMDFELPKLDFQNREIALEAKDSLTPTQQYEQKLDYSVGKVSIYNYSGSSILFDKQGIILVSDSNLEYRHVGQSNEPGTFRIPAGGQLNTNITIRAAGSGQRYNLSNGSKLKILNLRRQNFGPNLQAVVVEPIKDTAASQDKIVSQSDYDTLSEKVNQTLNTQKQSKIQEISADKNIFTSPNWLISNQPHSYTFSNEVGQVSNVLEANGKSIQSILVLPKANLEKQIKSKLEDLETIKDIQLVEAAAAQDKEKIPFKVKVTYSVKPELDKQAIANALSNQDDIDTTKENLKQQYPTISTIEEKQAGLKLPGVPARFDLEIQE